MKKIIIITALSLLFIGCAEETPPPKKNTSPNKNISNLVPKIKNPDTKQDIIKPDISEQEEPRPDFKDTKNFAQEFDQKYPGYTTLKPQILA
jgi:PBP1b-binding outer membrane lipoprotein LpoB